MRMDFSPTLLTSNYQGKLSGRINSNPQVPIFSWENLELLDLEVILEEFQFSINNEFDNSSVSNDSTKAKREESLLE